MRRLLLVAAAGLGLAALTYTRASRSRAGQAPTPTPVPTALAWPDWLTRNPLTKVVVPSGGPRLIYSENRYLIRTEGAVIAVHTGSFPQDNPRITESECKNAAAPPAAGVHPFVKFAQDNAVTHVVVLHGESDDYAGLTVEKLPGVEFLCTDVILTAIAAEMLKFIDPQTKEPQSLKVPRHAGNGPFRFGELTLTLEDDQPTWHNEDATSTLVVRSDSGETHVFTGDLLWQVCPRGMTDAAHAEDNIAEETGLPGDVALAFGYMGFTDRSKAVCRLRSLATRFSDPTSLFLPMHGLAVARSDLDACIKELEKSDLPASGGD